MSGIRKAFPGVVALDGIDFALAPGEVHVLLGENGAGKSTLMAVLGGACRRDAGAIELDGRPVALASPAEARAQGIAVIHQELALVPALSVAENIFLGRLPARLGLVDRAAMARDARAVLQRLDDAIDVRRPVQSLRLGQQQLVEIARALALEARVLVMDEPTSALTDREAGRLFAVVRDLAARGVSVVYITHRLEEIAAIGDRVTVLRDGRHVATLDARTAEPAALVRLMAARDVRAEVASASTAQPRDRLRVTGLTRRGVLHDVSFHVRAGEIVGFAGLLGAGRTEVARAVFGVDRSDRGTVVVDGALVQVRHPRDAIAAGIGFVTEDRKREGLLLDRSLRENVALPVLRTLSRWGVVRRAKDRALARDAVRDLRIKVASTRQPVRTLSGGNQQKVVLAKWIATGARVLFLDEPTRGIDVAAKQEIHAIIRRLAAAGTAVVVLSSDLPEVLTLADRTYVMRAGRIAGEFARADATPERVLACAVGA